MLTSFLMFVVRTVFKTLGIQNWIYHTGSGIGLASAKLIAKKGGKVALLARNAKNLEEGRQLHLSCARI